MYKYHDNTQVFDPKTQPYSFFYVTIAGQIETGDFLELDGLNIKYNFIAGSDWSESGGESSGTGSHAFKCAYGQSSTQAKINWNHPFEITYRSMNPFGWPQLVIYCNQIDALGNESCKAYGCTHVPIQPGVVQKTIRMFTPIEQNRCLEFFGSFQEGEDLKVDDPEMIAKAHARDHTRVKAGGKVTVTFQVTQRNMQRHGYVTGTEKK